MKKLSLVFVFVMLFVMLFAFSTFAANITNEASSMVTDGGGNVEATVDGNLFTGGSCGGGSWVNFHYLYENGTTVSKVVVVVNSIGDVKNADGSVVATHTTLSTLPNIYLRLYAGDSVVYKLENQATSGAVATKDAEGNTLYTTYTFDLGGTVYTDITKVEIATVHGNNSALAIWEVDIFDDQACETHEYQATVCGATMTCNACGAESEKVTEHYWKEATCAAPKTCSVCGTTEGEVAGEHTPEVDDNDCSTVVRCTVCDSIVVEAKKHVADENGACTNDGCTRVGEINVANKATLGTTPDAWWACVPGYLVDGDKSSATHSPKSGGFSYIFSYDDAKLISKIIVTANGDCTAKPAWNNITGSTAIQTVTVVLKDKDGFVVYETEAYSFADVQEVTIDLPYTYYAYSVSLNFTSTESWGNSFVREVEIYDTTVENLDPNMVEVEPPEEGCWERVQFVNFIKDKIYNDGNNGYIYLVDEDGNLILDEKGNAIKYAGAPFGGNAWANPAGCEIDGVAGSGLCITWEQQSNRIQYNFTGKLLFSEITIGYNTSGNVADGYVLWIGDIVDGEEVWTKVVEYIVPEEAEWGDYLETTFTLGEDGEGIEGSMFRFDWIPGVAIRNNPSLCEIDMITFKNTCDWVENNVLVEGNCGYDRKAECTCSVCGVEKLVVTAASGEHNKSVVEEAKAATCTDFGYNAVKYCATCEKTFGGDRIAKPQGHDMSVAATCTTPKSCSRCDHTEGDALGHKQGTAATCTEAAVCSVCGESYGEALGHKESEAVNENVVDATCTEAGSYDIVVCCSVCKTELSRKKVTVDALNHNYVAGEQAEDGSVTYTCTNNCGESYTVNNKLISGTYYIQSMDMFNAVFENGKVTISEAFGMGISGTYDYEYIINQQYVTVAGQSFFFTVDRQLKVEAFSYGRTMYVSEYIPPVELVFGDNNITIGSDGLTFVEFVAQEDGEYTIVAVDGDVLDPQTMNPFDASATFTLKAGESVTFYIGSWNNEVVVTVANAHVCSFVETSRVESTCTTPGKVVYTCDCGESKEEALELAAHTEVEIPAVLPTPTVTGMTAGVKCSECGEVLVAPEAITVKGNDNTNFRIRRAVLGLSESIAMIYKVTLPEGYEDAYIVFTYQGKEVIVSEKTYNETEQRWLFRFNGVTPQYMGTNVNATMYAKKTNGDYVEAVKTINYSVLEYCKAALAETGISDKIKALISDFLVYGANAQIATNTNVDNLVTKDVDLVASTFENIANNGKKTITGEKDASADWSNATLSLGSSVNMLFYFYAEDLEGLQLRFSINGREQIVNAVDCADTAHDYKGRTRYTAKFTNITAIEFDDAVKAELLRDGVQIGRTVTYSVNTYVYEAQTVLTGSALDLLKALYNYGNAAKNSIG